MKTVNVDPPPSGKIPLISPILHCMALPGVVFLRSSFGYSFFRPRSVMSALTFLVAVLVYIAWNEPAIWSQYRAMCIFAVAAFLLFWLHFAYAMYRHLPRTAELDDYSGKSHLLGPLKALGMKSEVAEVHLHLWIEPAIVVAIAAVMKLAFPENRLSAWLFIVAPCMAAAELINYWSMIRRDKRESDLGDETREKNAGKHHTTEAPQSTRVAPQKMERKVSITPEKDKESKFAALLGLSLPYDLDEAETNYREKIRAVHPDNNENSEESNRKAAELNEAIEFFRQRLT